MSKPTKRMQTALRYARRWLLLLGVTVLGFYAFTRVHGVITLHAASPASAETRHSSGGAANGLPALRVNTALWSPGRIKAYRNSLLKKTDAPLAVLRIPKLRLEAPVYNGMDDTTLDAGVGIIPGTAHPGQRGDIGIAGHRDGFFRSLKDIARGDAIELVTASQTTVYVVEKITITSPDDVQVLRPPKPGLTLVTCYPFYFVGSAPRRFIVQAYPQ